MHAFFCSAVQLSSPKLNTFIIAGCLLMYFSALVQLLYTTNETANHISCIVRMEVPFAIREYHKRVKMAHTFGIFPMQLHTWMYVMGYMLTFGTILAKMWRVYQIFHNPTPNKVV